jgi:hypothetical protein
MTAKPEIGQADEDQLAQQRQPSPSDEVREATRIAALLHDRFGIER